MGRTNALRTKLFDILSAHLGPREAQLDGQGCAVAQICCEAAEPLGLDLLVAIGFVRKQVSESRFIWASQVTDASARGHVRQDEDAEVDIGVADPGQQRPAEERVVHAKQAGVPELLRKSAPGTEPPHNTHEAIRG